MQGGGNEIKEKALYREANRCLNSSCQMNVYDIMEEILLRTRIRMNREEKESFIKKHLTNIELVVDRQGNINLSLK